MTLIEAIKSGKRFRLKGRSVGWEGPSDYLGFRLTRNDVISDDWEIEEPSITITRTQFYEAVRDCLYDAGVSKKYSCTLELKADKLAKKLGLE